MQCHSLSGIFVSAIDKTILIPAKRYSTRYLTFAVFKEEKVIMINLLQIVDTTVQLANNISQTDVN